MLRNVYLLVIFTLLAWPAVSPAATADKTAYDQAMASYNAGDYNTARSGFQRMLQSYPGSRLAPNALYWIGETYYSQKDYTEAILAFRLVPYRHPGHSKAAAALLKMGFAYQLLGDDRNAVTYLNDVLSQYPSSSPANLARKKLSSILSSAQVAATP